MDGRRVARGRVGAAVLMVALACVFCAAPSLALAEEGPAEPPPAAEGTGEPPVEKAPAQSAPPDVVILRDGSFVRGTISELVAGKHVVIVPVVGEPRQFSMSEVTYAGPAAGAPPSAASAPVPAAPASATAPPSTPVVTVEVRAPDNVTSLHVWGHMNADGSPGATRFSEKEPLCTAPCTLKLPVGEYRFGLSGHRGHIERIARPFDIRQNTRLEATYVDRRRSRTAGWVILGISALIGGAMVFVGDSSGNRDIQLAGGLAGGAGIVVGLLLGVQMDSAKLSVAGERTR